jgi:hypothetical protein
MSNKEKAINTTGPTQEQIEAWKAKYGTVKMFEVDGHKCYLRKPDRKILSLAMKKSQKNPLDFNETILSNCWLAGDEIFKTDDDMFMAISGELDTLIQQKMVDVKEL